MKLIIFLTVLGSLPWAVESIASAVAEYRFKQTMLAEFRRQAIKQIRK